MAGSDGRAFELRDTSERFAPAVAAVWHESSAGRWAFRHYTREGLACTPTGYTRNGGDAAKILARQCPTCGSQPGRYTILHDTCPTCEGTDRPTWAGLDRLYNEQ